ncbi:MAG: Ldh family oxidoreductase [Lentisphaerae bacterium]|nr:Ldh family oxidoreductase [Lentisphaerota bacterium]
MYSIEEYSDCTWIDHTLLEQFIQDIFVKLGTPPEEAAIIADVLITSDKRGIDSHGIGRLKPIYIDRIDQGILSPVTNIEVVNEGPTTAVLDGHNGMGHVVARRAMEMAIAKARTYGTAMVAVRNSSHYGIAGYYAEMCAAADMIGITGTNARPSSAPTFGVENMLGTNPLTIGFPTDEPFAFNIDCATSMSQRGKIESYARAGKKLPPGWVIDHDGQTQTDPETVLEALTKGNCALTPLGGIGEETAGYKGYGYATAVEVLSAALSNAKFTKDLNGTDADGKRIPYPLGHFFIAVNIASFIEPALFKSIAGTIMRQLRASRKAAGVRQIYTAGEKEWIAWQYRREHGIPVPPVLQEQLSALNSRFDLNYQFPWRRS